MVKQRKQPNKQQINEALNLIEDIISNYGMSAVIYSPELGVYTMYKDKPSKLMIHDSMILEMEAERLSKMRSAESMQVSDKQNMKQTPTLKYVI